MDIFLVKAIDCVKDLKGKDHKNTLEFCLKVFAKLNILKQTAWKSDIYF